MQRVIKREAVDKVMSLWSRIPGASASNAAEFMYDLLTEEPEPTDEEVEAYHQERASGEPPLSSDEISRRIERGMGNG